MELDREQIDKLRLGAITAIDGLWFLSVENHLDFDTALKIDLDVWKNYGIIILKRMGKMAGRPLGKGELIDLPTVKFFLETLSKIDGTEYASEFLDDSTLEFKVHRCPWYENLKEGRQGKGRPLRDDRPDHLRPLAGGDRFRPLHGVHQIRPEGR